MTTLNYTFHFNKTILLSLMTLCNSPMSFALQPLSDETLSSTTGEGIALVPQDAYFVFQGENSTANDLTDRSKDTGYIHVIPVILNNKSSEFYNMYSPGQSLNYINRRTNQSYYRDISN